MKYIDRVPMLLVCAALLIFTLRLPQGQQPAEAKPSAPQVYVVIVDQRLATTTDEGESDAEDDDNGFAFRIDEAANKEGLKCTIRRGTPSSSRCAVMHRAVLRPRS
jgi:hypothetical protein